MISERTNEQNIRDLERRAKAASNHNSDGMVGACRAARVEVVLAASAAVVLAQRQWLDATPNTDAADVLLINLNDKINELRVAIDIVNGKRAAGSSYFDPGVSR